MQGGFLGKKGKARRLSKSSTVPFYRLNAGLNIAITVVILFLAAVTYVMFFSDIRVNIICTCTIGAISYVSYFMLSDLYRSVRAYEDVRIFRGKCLVVKNFSSGVLFNGCELDFLCIAFYQNSVVFSDDYNRVLLDAPYESCDIMVDIFDDFLEIQVRNGFYTDVICIRDMPLELQFLYELFVWFGANFDDEWISYSFDEVDKDGTVWQESGAGRAEENDGR